MVDFTPLNEVETEPTDVKMEDASENELSEEENTTPTTESSQEACEADVKLEVEGDQTPKAAKGKGAKGKAMNGKKANGPVKEEKEEKTPVTPRKRGRKGKTAGEGVGTVTAEEADDEAETPSKKKRGTPGKGTPGKAGKRALPGSLEEASEEDKMMLRMRDEENKPWSEIRAAWEEITGEAVGGSTLSNRYQRIKANFTEAKLLQVKMEIEEKFESEKWCRIADAMESAGGKRYPAAALQKKFKELGRKKGTGADE
ncbi:conserved hypothetical protein [Microsporum canis CBS 113480]|uniref:Uncharacterized protein n=1 Tax=Arthroderma otae (strain ATCC MYA-4605 / CBS 113480) TaxID=554155 RepID=C5FN39_ARTOC|nr:conserved hypothetical protein [Microsporum canis CBS 113480]EEQ31275.1 conserved hypothetical protein [Microsporum canis CBS 113480]